MEEKWYKLLKIAGYYDKYMRFHDTRGNYVDLMLNNGMPLTDVSRDVGHARTQTTAKTYSQRNKTGAERKKDYFEEKIFKKQADFS